jgi:phage-related minor tail protein
MNSAIDNFVDNGKFSFSDLTNSIIKDIIKIQLRASVANLLSTGANFLGFSLPGRAAGGPVSSGRPYIVGEQGPEVFIPSGSGNIIPNSRLNTSLGASGNTVVNYNIQAVDALSFKQLVARDPTFIYAVTQQGAKALPSTRR